MDEIVFFDDNKKIYDALLLSDRNISGSILIRISSEEIDDVIRSKDNYGNIKIFPKYLLDFYQIKREGNKVILTIYERGNKNINKYSNIDNIDEELTSDYDLKMAM